MGDKGDLGQQIGVDTGGTFTDLIMRGDDGTIRVEKLLSTPADPSQAIGAGVEAVKCEGSKGSLQVIHGTTVATNALLERRGAEVAFLTTRGFEDLLWMGRQNRPELYALNVEGPNPLVEQDLCFGVQERLDAQGRVIEALDDAEVRRLVRALKEDAPQAVVVCLLHAYANGIHEQRLAKALRNCGMDWHVTASHEVSATFREYERASTTVINGYVGPVMEGYLDRLQRRLSEVDRLEVLQSHGGRTDTDHAARLPVHTVLSGPAGGVVGALKVARSVELERVISVDMGGTSTDVSLANGELTLSEDAKIGGFPLQVPVINIHTVGAGGGSIAYVDAGGALRVGPRSAGADPGPAAYGSGGVEPTVTDAHVVLGSLRPDRFLGGEMDLDRKAAIEAVDELAAQLDSDRDATAQGILDVADAAMARAIKVISLERGHDPRDYALVAFGGAGGLHACRLARLLEVPTVIVPQYPGLLSAVGMLDAEAKRLYTQTFLRPLDQCFDGGAHRDLRARMKALQGRARSEMGAPAPEYQWVAALRYEGQSYAIEVEVDWTAERTDFGDPTPDFEAEHRRLYGYIAEEQAIELVELRLEARRRPIQRDAALRGARPSTPVGAPATESIDLGQGPVDTLVVQRSSLAEEDIVQGPAIITEYSGTTVVLQGWSAQVRCGHLMLQRDEGL